MAIRHFLRAGPGPRNREEERAAVSGCALDPDASAVRLDDAAGEGKSEAGALTVCSGRLPEAVKDAGQVLGRDTTPRIGNPEDNVVVPYCRAGRGCGRQAA